MSHTLVEASLLSGEPSFTMAEASPNPAGRQSLRAPTPNSSVIRQWSGSRN